MLRQNTKSKSKLTSPPKSTIKHARNGVKLSKQLKSTQHKLIPTKTTIINSQRLISTISTSNQSIINKLSISSAKSFTTIQTQSISTTTTTQFNTQLFSSTPLSSSSIAPSISSTQFKQHPISLNSNSFSTSTTTTDSPTTTSSPSSSAHHIPTNCSDPKITQLFTMLNNGLLPMLETNPGMTITTENDIYELNLGSDYGIYQFQRDPNEDYLLQRNTHVTLPIITMISPISGNMYRYYYDDKRLHQWISIDDEHYLVELLTRELLKKCYGYPMF